MAWVVDTCVLIDVLEADPRFGDASAEALERASEEGLVVCPVTYAELAPTFNGDRTLQDEFLGAIGVDWTSGWTWNHTVAAHRAWHRYVILRRRQHAPRRPLADIFIGAFSTANDGLMTRNVDDFLQIFPELPILNPMD